VIANKPFIVVMSLDYKRVSVSTLINIYTAMAARRAYKPTSKGNNRSVKIEIQPTRCKN